VLYFYATNLGVDMGEPRALEGCMGNYLVSYTSLQKNVRLLFAENAACILRTPLDTFKCIQFNAFSINKCKYELNIVMFLVAENLKGEKNA
jgi:hypothetical protein